MFEKRGKAFEDKYFREEEKKFRIISRRRKLLGLWAADQMHLSDEDALHYALEIVRFGVDDHTEGAVVTKIFEDLNKTGIALTEEDIRRQMDKLHRTAEKEVNIKYS